MQQLNAVREEFAAMGTVCTLHVEHAETGLAERAITAAIDEVDRIEARYSRYRPDSVLSAINAVGATGGVIAIDGETLALLDFAGASHRASNGLFDITAGILRRAWDFSEARLPEATELSTILEHVGMNRLSWTDSALTLAPGTEIDLGGLGKEYAVDRIADIWRGMGVASGLIDLGGDIRAVGSHLDGRPWRVAIRHPRDPDRPLAEVDLVNLSLATSGDYERFIEVDGVRYCHILNPKTGYPVAGMASASIIAPSCMVAGSLSTIAILAGLAAGRWLDQVGVRHLCVMTDGAVFGSEPTMEPAGHPDQA